MKTPVWIGIVVILHVVIIGSVAMFQGCGTTRVAPPPEPVMPPPPEVARPLPPPPERPPLPPPRPIEPPGDTVEYVVRSGDTLSAIAVRHKVPVNRIVELNNIADPNRLRAGQKLIIPLRPGVTVHQPQVAPAPARPAARPTGDGTEYVVQAGDTLSEIALRFNTKVARLRELNNLDGDKILIGQKLMVDGKPKPAPAPAAKPAPAPVADDADVDFPAPSAAPGMDAAVDQHDIVHVVMSNEDLDYISRLYVVPVEDIIRINNLPDGKIKAGQKLIIP